MRRLRLASTALAILFVALTGVGSNAMTGAASASASVRQEVPACC